MKAVWLDVDPVASKGHDDAIAILMAIHLHNINLLGVSTVHGNVAEEKTSVNAAKCLHAFSAPPNIKVFRGAVKPLTRKAKAAPSIHGDSGLGGVVGLDFPGSPELVRFAHYDDGTPVPALRGMANTIEKTWNGGAGHKVSVVSCGPMTNIALFVSAYPELLDAVEEFVFMGGGVGLGNYTPVAEFNIVCDPEAAQIVLDCPVKTVMVPLNVTHTAVATKNIHSRLCSAANDEIVLPSTSLRKTLSSLITFFGDTYKEVFGFSDGPPLHDALTIVYVSNPELFKYKRYRVDIELHGEHTIGETVVDLWDYKRCDETWGATGKNCIVLESLEVDKFFDTFFACVERCDKTSPINIRQ
ncbi:uridine nucleosidase [Phlebopus sp. FC_14]|nr:uridine nucleosidase [Phlebopus sp. FC_14]